MSKMISCSAGAGSVHGTQLPGHDAMWEARLSHPKEAQQHGRRTTLCLHVGDKPPPSSRRLVN